MLVEIFASHLGEIFGGELGVIERDAIHLPIFRLLYGSRRPSGVPRQSI